MSIPSTIFSKHLSNVDVQYRLAVPTRSLDDLPAFPEGQNHVLVPVTDEAGRAWNFRLSKRRKGFAKPVISSKDWNNCVRVNQLREGDIITFCKKNGEDWNGGVTENHLPEGRKITFYVENGEGNEGKNGGGGGDDGNNSGGGGRGSGDNNKKESRDRERDSNGDKDKRSRDDEGGDVKGKNMDCRGEAFFGYKFGYHAGYENGYPVGQLKCVQVVQ